MIICVCFNVSDKQIKPLMPCSVEDVMMKTDAGMCCGKCIQALQEIVDLQTAEVVAEPQYAKWKREQT